MTTEPLFRERLLASFSRDYAQARDRFRAACRQAGVEPQAFRNPAPGPLGLELTTDTAWFGDRLAPKLLILNSGTHGVEGLVGSGCQISWILGGGPAALCGDVAVLLIHMLNPWGAAWRRRQTEDNVDLNRNFLPAGEPRPKNPHYEALRSRLSGPFQAVWPEIRGFREERGEQAYSAALFQGQYEDGNGIGFGGHGPVWSNRILRQILTDHAQRASEVIFIDYHSGVGPYGYGALLIADMPGTESFDRAHACFGPSLRSVAAGALPYPVSGDLCTAVTRWLKRNHALAVGLEFGTFELDRLLSLQIDDCWLEQHGDPLGGEGQRIRKELQDFFFPGTLDWLEMVERRSSQIICQALAGLSSAALQ